MLKKICLSLLMIFSVLAVQPITAILGANSVVEASVVNVDCGGAQWEVYIDDSSIYMVKQNHAHVAVSTRCLETNADWSSPQVVDVMWGKGYVCNYLYSGKPVSPSDIGLAIANYMSARY